LHLRRSCQLNTLIFQNTYLSAFRTEFLTASSRRQYIFQFEKWGINKYNTNIARQGSTPAESHALLSQYPLYARTEQLSKGSDFSQLSIISSQPPKRPQSLREKPPVPPKKRKKLADFLSSKGPYADLGLAFHAPNTPGPSSGNLMQGIQSANSLGRMPTSSINGAADTPTPVPSMLNEDDDCTTSSDTSDSSILPPQSEISHGWGFLDFEPWTSQCPLDEIPLQEKQIDSSRRIDTFSLDEVDDMKRAADFLFGLGCEADACSLYILILKRLKDCPDQPAWATTSAMILCASSANTPSQKEIARSLLEQSLDEPQGSKTDIEKFLFHMLLAETYMREHDTTTADIHIGMAMSTDLANKGLVTCLPREYRALDILTYHYLTGGLRGPLEPTKLRSSKLHFADKREVQQLLLHNDPGPFELMEGSMKNPCLRSCIKWCVDELELMPSLSSSWELVKTNKKSTIWAEIIGIYCCLWERSQSRQTNYEGTILWIDQAERSMGISAAELLSTVYYMILSASPPGKDKSERDFVRQAHMGAISLSQRPDEQVGCQFLEGFSSMNSLSANSGNQKASRSVIQAYAKDFIQKKSWVKPPDVQTDALQACTPRQSPEIVAAAFLPTLASSLHSSELASLRSIRDRMQRNVRDAMQGVTMTLPSSALRASSRSVRSVPTISMSDLSQAMASSLSLSSLQRASSPALDTLATVVAH
jgi:hypothetical protein